MTQLIYQRTASQCAIATIAMATGRDYDEVLAAGMKSGAFSEDQGCRSLAEVLQELGYDYSFSNGHPVGDFVSRYRAFETSPEFFRAFSWGRRAIMTVPSLNITDGDHSVYWDGREVFDPNPSERLRYVSLDQLLPSELILFREAA